ncbi:lipopolysaccharide biosynthesis protein [Tolypothrix sp. PCC 7910]|uniref:lipopolysaccharide biosynthesis protein n=1 Tax=Tolypothrix sp. PCC 7910 TaxID=2099387 RepID=UPI00142786CD|nr:lipopolysaccharide biosynthesis protein [Tolypothrix sp. PCC 7910]QIR37968.1 lipopolysaccharide biosynthesis protein [Tolypothrix sp. PCC 7910]
MLINNIRQTLSTQFIRNVGWLGGAELANRIFRLGTTFTLARMFSPYDYGLVAVILTTNEFANVVTLKSGISSKIIQADEQNLKVICNTSYWLNWIVCIFMFILQCMAAFPIAWFYGNNRIILPICFSSLVYLMLPLFMVQCALIQRENRLNIIALCNITQSLSINILTITLAILGLGVWSVILPIVITTPIWIVINNRNHKWQPPKSFQLKQWQEILCFSKDILGVEFLNKLRSNIDYLIVGRFLSIDALGIYYFAFNAGLGISLNVVNAFTTALFPHLCEVREDFKQMRSRYFSSLKSTATFVIPLILLQSSLAPLYVPFIFGQKWVTAIPVLILICLSALSLPLYNATSLLINAVGKTHINLYFNLIYTLLFAVFLLFAVKWGIFWIAVTVLVCQLVIQGAFSIWAIKYIFTRPPNFYMSNKQY